MEQSTENAIIVSIQKNEEKLPKRKSSGPMHVLKVALFMMRGGGGRSKKTNLLPLDTKSKNGWKKIVGSMRPMHLQSDESPRSFAQGKPSQQITLQTPLSPCESLGAFTDCHPEEESSLAPSPASSRYASAVGLNELVQCDEENEKQDVIMEEIQEADHGIDGDDKIDAKADEFIAQFYQQMRLQRLNNVFDPRYQERSQRSLGNGDDE